MSASRTARDRAGASPSNDIASALRLARKRLRSSRAVSGLSRTVFVPVLGGAAWIGLYRFTLLELPRWPVVVVPGIWALCLLIWIYRQRPSRYECARYLDSRLGLDERISTFLELQGRAKYEPEARSPFLETLAADAAHALKQSDFALPRSSGVRLPRWYGPAQACILALLLGVLLVPTSLDAVKAEKRALRAGLESQAATLEQFRAELVTRPDLPDDLKTTLDSQLRALEAKLRDGTIDRSDALAALASAEEQLRGLMPNISSSEFEPLIRAAQNIEFGAERTVDWDPSLVSEADDLGKAADAIEYTRNILNTLTGAQVSEMAGTFERAADTSDSEDSELAQHLVDGAGAIRSRDNNKAATELEAARQRFLEAQQQRQAAAAIENTLAKLSDGRQQIAKAGAPTAKRQQVGFRRVQPTATAVLEAAAGTPDAQGGLAANGTPPVGSNSQLGQLIGQNQPAFGVNPGPNKGGQPSKGQGTNSGGPSTTGQSGGPAGTTGSTGSTGAGTGAGGGSGNNTGGSGTVSGQITGPVRVGGASGAGAGAAGNGTGSASSGQGGSQASASNPDSESLYVPGTDPLQRTGIGGQAAPEQTTGVNGKAGSGDADTQRPSDPGLGQVITIRTPYNQVLGQYSQQATQALDRQYIPSDAKDYVRSYFTGLAK